MDPAFGKTFSQVMLIVAAGLTFFGVWGHWYFSKQTELIGRYRMPIRIRILFLNLKYIIS